MRRSKAVRSPRLRPLSPCPPSRPGVRRRASIGAPGFPPHEPGRASRSPYRDAALAHKAVAVIFIATKCPYSNAYNTRMKDLAAAYEKQGVLFVGINSNKSEPEEEARAHAREHGHTFPIAKDPGNKVADLYDAKRTPEVFLVAPDGKVKYHGRIDDNSEDASKVTSPDLKNALDALLAGKPIQNAQTKAFGCTIKRV